MSYRSIKKMYSPMRYKQQIQTILRSIVLTLFLIIGKSAVYAAGAPPKIDGLMVVFLRVLALFPPVAGLVAIAMVVMAGYMWMTSAGDPGKVKQAQGTMTWAVLGLVLTSLIWTILRSILLFLET